MIRQLQELAHGLGHMFYPRLCEGCSKPLLRQEVVLCVGCSLEIADTDYHDQPDNDTVLRLAGRIPFEHATSLAYFTGDSLLQHLIHRLKYEGRKDVGLYLGARLGRQLRASSWASGIDIVVPVPLHPQKESLRGYNQAMVIAAGLGAALGVPASDQVLLRARNTESQTRKSRAERVDNMKDAFYVGDHANVAGRHLLLCDDVLTTGATLESCALALLTRENIKISVATIGIAVS